MGAFNLPRKRKEMTSRADSQVSLSSPEETQETFHSRALATAGELSQHPHSMFREKPSLPSPQPLSAIWAPVCIGYFVRESKPSFGLV